ncbi:c-type cytochrome biogenesis protein CcsB [Corynebacterium macginleyi]|uniref:c-type cytochrome biogenesis protein CcsB n=1 Tax=Corynebacterium macginleyi TaxID=38290 RepID=UPI00190C6820|nr:c-type cytochrome biogenesis protein CcsB [Corynebacterium macginleyi]MBK4150732.1 c-type cytochrome biogenesis protein CcsB [Corynebacterium macginleyi]MBK4162037.1 c-type cytochrome biogenesis protein CcsB [Corynebacterium macginleyi]MBK4167950.1 c-type cytochrome biogenesis protein CcsB [Corynebacterium macginleyi]MBK4183095.1 c-type cytochrome biogenesis protein CcsB [Corynebacterium macginleyi]
MQIDQNLSNFSDIAVQTAFVVYCIALFMSLLYYGRMRSLIEARRVNSSAASKVLVGTGADGGVDVKAGTDTTAANTDYEAEVSAAAATLDPEEVADRERKLDKLGGMTSSLMWVAIALHAAAIVLRGLATGRFPFGNLYEYVLMVCFGVLLVGNIAMQRKEWRTVWPWILTPVLALMFYGSTKLYADSAPVVPALQSHWLPIHVTVVSLGASIGIISGIASLLSLLRQWQPKHAERSFFGALAYPLPSAVKIDRLAYRLGVITLPTLGLGIILGAIWAESAWGRPWGWDPKETVSFATWILYAAYLHARATPAFRKAAPWINVLAMAVMVFNLFFINMVVSGLHSYAGLN